MFEGLDELYQELIRDHYRRPRNHGRIEGADRSVELLNPLCGDEVTVDLKLEGERVADVRFFGRGCTISQSSASLMTELIKGKSVAEAADLVGTFRAFMRNEADADQVGEKLGDLVAFQGVPRKYATRVRCAMLAWNALDLAMRGKTGRATTNE